MKNRRRHVDSIIERLEVYRKDAAYTSVAYAIEENIRFMKAIRSPFMYLRWLLTRAARLDGSKLLELTDFPEESWDVNMHTRLIEMQKNKNIGLVEPLAAAVDTYLAQQPADVIIANLGAGGMEVDRQIIERASTTEPHHRFTIVSIDKSSVTRSIARSNLKGLADVTVIEAGDATPESIRGHIARSKTTYTVILCSNDIFTLDKTFGGQFFDLMYHSLFRHHLMEDDKKRLQGVVRAVAKKSIEFDGFRSISVVIPQTIVGWNYPEFFNAEMFSNARFESRASVVERARGCNKIQFFRKTGFYLLEWN